MERGQDKIGELSDFCQIQAFRTQFLPNSFYTDVN